MWDCPLLLSFHSDDNQCYRQDNTCTMQRAIKKFQLCCYSATIVHIKFGLECMHALWKPRSALFVAQDSMIVGDCY